LSCAVCLPALAGVNKWLLLAIFRFLNALEVGSGKGVAIPSVLRACQQSGVMDAELEEQTYTFYATAFEKYNSDESAVDGLEDAYFILKGAQWNVPADKKLALPVGNQAMFDDEGFEHSVVASVMSIALLSPVGTSNLRKLAQLDEAATDDDINAVIALLCDAISLGDDSRACSMGKIAMGLLSSVTHQESSEEEDEAPPYPNSDVPNPSNEASVMRLPVEQLPSPHHGTVLEGVRNAILAFYEAASVDPTNASLLSRALLSVADISIPDKYAIALIEPILRRNVARKAGVKLLSAQVSNRRRAFSDGRSFQALATKILLAPSDEWVGWLGASNSQRVLVLRLRDIGPKLSVDDFGKCLNNVWKICKNSPNPDMIDCFLLSLQSLLLNTAILPKSMALVRDFCRGDLFQDIRALQRQTVRATAKTEASSTSNFDLYVECLKEIPLSELDGVDFFSFEDDESSQNLSDNAFRAFLVLALIDLHYFDRSNDRSATELTNVGSWLSKYLAESSSSVPSPKAVTEKLRRVMCAFAAATMREPVSTKHERIASILEVSLLTGKSSSKLVLEWLAVVLSFWYGCEESNGDLSLSYLCTVEPKRVQALRSQDLEFFFHVILDDLPENVSLYCRREKLSTMVNQLHRVLKCWTDLGVDQKLLGLVQRAILSSPISAANEDIVISLASSVLRDNQV